MMKLQRQCSAPHQTQDSHMLARKSYRSFSQKHGDIFSPVDELRAARLRRRSQLNEELRMKAKDLEEQYAAYKLKLELNGGEWRPVEETRFVEIRGRFYVRYMEKREERMKEEPGTKRSERKAEMEAMRASLERSEAELKAQWKYLPTIECKEQVIDEGEQIRKTRNDSPQVSHARNETAPCREARKYNRSKSTIEEINPFKDRKPAVRSRSMRSGSVIPEEPKNRVETKPLVFRKDQGHNKSESANSLSRDATKGFKRLMQFGRKSNEANSFVSVSKVSKDKLGNYSSPSYDHYTDRRVFSGEETPSNLKPKEHKRRSPLKGYNTFFSISSPFQSKGSELKVR